MDKNFLYSREIAAGIDIATLQHKKVFLGGAGNTGSHMMERFLQNFINNVFIIDFDKNGYEVHNFAHSSVLLNYPDDIGKHKAEILAKRAAEKSFEDSIYIGRTMDVKDIGPYILKHFDIVLGFFDNVSARKHLYEMSRIAGVPFLEVGISKKGRGQVQLFNHDKEAPCYCCTAPAVETYQSCGIVYENDLKNGIAPNTDIAGSMVTTKAMREIMEFFSNPNYECNVKHILDEDTFTFNTYRMVKNPNCLVCQYEEVYDDVIELEGSVDCVSYKEFKEMAENKVGKKVNVCLPCVFVVKDNCPVCGKEHLFMKPSRRINASDLICKGCINSNELSFMEQRIKARDNSFTGFDELSNEFQKFTLYDLGFGYGYIITVMDNEGVLHYFTMKDDTKIISDFIKGGK